MSVRLGCDVLTWAERDQLSTVIAAALALSLCVAKAASGNNHGIHR